jgi:type I restriction enzyme S subunit
VLLERIRAEKQRLIVEGKIKRDKHESVIFRRDNSHYEKCGSEELCIDEEIPFDIPNSWVWCRLRTLLQQASTGPFGSMLHKNDYTLEGIPIINPADIKDGNISTAKIKKVSEKTALRLSSYLLHQGDVIIGRRGEMGRSATIGKHKEGWLCGTGCFYVTPLSVLSPDYLVFFLKSPYAKALLTENSVGTTMNNLNHTILGNMLIPLPPVAEQATIIAQYDIIQSIIDV